MSTPIPPLTSTYDHTHKKIRDPVRSPLDKLVRARPVVGWVTTSESLVLYVFFNLSDYHLDPPCISIGPPPPS